METTPAIVRDKLRVATDGQPRAITVDLGAQGVADLAVGQSRHRLNPPTGHGWRPTMAFERKFLLAEGKPPQQRAAGPELSGEMRRRYPAGTPTGNAVATGAYALPARWVIHAVGPVWGLGGQDKLDLLASAYRSALQVADELGARTICSPAIRTGTFGFPAETAADVALRTVREPPRGDRHRAGDVRP